MKYLKWLLLLPVAAFPYGYLAELYGAYIVGGSARLPIDPSLLLWLFRLAALAVVLIIFFTRDRWTGRDLALAGMLVKLVQIPAYVLWFLVGMAFFLLAGPVMAFFVDAQTILLSGLVGLAAVLRCRTEGKLERKTAVIHGILQFIFCADVFSAIWVYIKSRKEITL